MERVCPAIHLGMIFLAGGLMQDRLTGPADMRDRQEALVSVEPLDGRMMVI
jgi:hypothetical protein|tara:strand:- start:703 stop:855 length:153 start_codon:yes stop_codon:yes gene_type:complete